MSLLFSGCASTCGVKKCQDMELQVKNLESRLNTLESGRALGDIAVSDISISEQSAISAESLTNTDIQAALKNAGFYNGTIDGKIGRNTKKAIEEFQAANNLKADGVAGAKTRAVLIKHLVR